MEAQEVGLAGMAFSLFSVAAYVVMLTHALDRPRSLSDFRPASWCRSATQPA